MKRNDGISVLEFLIVAVIIGIVAVSISFTGRQILRGQEQLNALSALERLVAQGLTAASARDVVAVLRRSGSTYEVFDTQNQRVLLDYTLPDGVSTNFLSGGQTLNLLPVGKISNQDFDNLPQSLTLSTANKSYTLKLSLIGQLVAEETS